MGVRIQRSAFPMALISTVPGALVLRPLLRLKSKQLVFILNIQHQIEQDALVV
ncbi:hypothetical protein C0J52_14077 [Blattella germanica]|nr:hypothetical protein C0J52_14077 [Blattella germanica]